MIATAAIGTFHSFCSRSAGDQWQPATSSKLTSRSSDSENGFDTDRRVECKTWGSGLVFRQEEPDLEVR